MGERCRRPLHGSGRMGHMPHPKKIFKIARWIDFILHPILYKVNENKICPINFDGNDKIQTQDLCKIAALSP